MGATSIEWTDFSHNPIRARLRGAAHAGVTKGGYGSGVGHYCEKCSPGCANCYSSASQPRFGMPEFPGVRRGEPPVEVFLDERRLVEPLTWRKPRRVFLCDMTDLFGPWVPFAWVDRIFAVMALTPHLTWQVLTKRPERMAEYFSLGDERRSNVCDEMNRIEEQRRGPMERAMHDYGEPDPWPLPNVWLGTSVEDQKRADERVPHLLRCPAAVRFLSCEPLLGRVTLTDVKASNGTHDYLIDCLNGLHGCSRGAAVDWVIVGGESGHGARPLDVNWVRSIVRQCRDAGVAAFVKQLGPHPHVGCVDGDGMPVDGSNWPLVKPKDKKGGEPSEWPTDLRDVRAMPGVKAPPPPAGESAGGGGLKGIAEAAR